MSYLHGLKKRGHVAQVKNGKLVVTPPMTPHLKAQVAAARDEILLELARTTPDAPRSTCRWCGAEVALVPYPDSRWHWTRCESCGEAGTHYVPADYVLIDSAVVGATIAVGDKCPRRAGLAAFTWAECRRLLDATPEMIRAVCRLKRAMPGVTVEAGSNDEGFWWEHPAEQLLIEGGR